ncbi:MAG TPA: lysozyme inhibitor LprI family protein [Dyella sp.]|nr:lysozyme inhibitor LprI family protein [Dyella sp.]
MKRATVVGVAFCAWAMSGAAFAGQIPASASTTVAASSGDTCMDHAQSQADMASCAVQSLNAADKELNQVYQQVLKKHAANKAFVAKLKAAQKAWLAFRDAELAARFPEGKSQYASAYPMCADGEVETLTRQRTEQLRQWLRGAQEGDVCAGSYPST